MFNFLTTLFSKTILAIAGTLISIGGAMGGTQINEDKPVIPVVNTSTSTVIAPVAEPNYKNKSVTEKVPPIIAPVPAQAPATVAPAVTAADVTAQIKAAQDVADAKAAEAAREVADIAAQEAAKKSAELSAQQAVNAAAQEKEAKLNAINLQIATLNAKYAADVIKIENQSIAMPFINGQKQALYNKYLNDYNVLMAQWQQIKYSN